MTTFSQIAPGDVINLDFPYAEGGDAKNRPALVLSSPNAFGDFTVAMISSGAQDDGIPVTASDFAHGQLGGASFVRIRRLYTVKSSALVKKRGALKGSTMSKVLAKLCPSLGCKS
jgi:mRNA-degrading endonuclease toxin of MazEF toxin-antitoxin module